MKKQLLVSLALSTLLVPSTALSETVWVCNSDSNSVSIINTETDEVETFYPAFCVPQNNTCLDEPIDIVFDPAASFAYILNKSGGKVIVLDTSGVPDYAPTFVGFQWADDGPEGMALSPDGHYLYVTASQGDVMYIYDAEDNPGVPYLEHTVDVGNDPGGIAITPNGETALVANNASDNVSVVDLTLDPPEEITTLNVGTAPRRIIVGDIDGVGVRAYTVNANSDNVTVIEVDGSPSVVTSVNVGDKPRGLAFYPDMGSLLVANFDGYSISSIDTTTNSASTFSDSLEEKPFRVAITADGLKAYVSNPGPDQVSVFNASNGELATEIPVGYTPGAVAILGD
jgi:DNA-binding beta-propeller fold protein YncE